MTPQDQQLIEGLITRARPLASPPDPDAERLLGSKLAAEPALAAALVRRVAQLEASLADAQQRLSTLPAPATGGAASSAAPPPASSAARPRPRRGRLSPLRRSPLRPPSVQARRRTRPTLVTPSSPQRRPGVAVEAAGSCAARPRRRPAWRAACWRPRRSKGWPTSSAGASTTPTASSAGSIPPAGTAPEEVIVNNYYGDQPPADETSQATTPGRRTLRRTTTTQSEVPSAMGGRTR